MKTLGNNYTISKKFHCIVPDIESFSIKTVGIDVEDSVDFVKKLITKKYVPSRPKRHAFQLAINKTIKKRKKGKNKGKRAKKVHQSLTA